MIENVFFLCSQEEIGRERQGYMSAFAKKANVKLVELSFREKYEGLDFSADQRKPDLLIYPDNYLPRLPMGIEKLGIPTICMHFDTYSDTSFRMKFSSLFDYVFVAHPAFVDEFRTNKINNTFLLPHAVEQEYFQLPPASRIFDIGWVGRLDGEIYQSRKKIIDIVKTKYIVNDPYKFYDYKNLADIYMQSKIGINFSRSDYPQDANLRCFEIMAGGALLLTGCPTELEQIGFKEGYHFRTYKSLEHLLRLIDYYLINIDERVKISKAGQQLTLSRHTYDARVQTIFEVVKMKSEHNGRSTFNAGSVYLEYAYRKGLFTEYFFVVNAYKNLSRFTKIVYLFKFMTKYFYNSLKMLLKS